MNKIFIVLFSLILLVLSCTGNKKEKTIKEKPEFPLLFSEYKVKEEIRSIIGEYITKYPHINFFFLMPYNSPNMDSIKGFMLGPAYEEIVLENVPSFYLSIEEKTILIKGGIEIFLGKSDNIDLEKIKDKTIKQGQDSLLTEAGWITKDPYELFIRNGIYLYFYNEKTWVNFRPDTIFLPRYLESSVAFKNEY